MKIITIILTIIIGWLHASGSTEAASTSLTVAPGLLVGVPGNTIPPDPPILPPVTDTFNRADSNPMTTSMSDGQSVWVNGDGAMDDIRTTSNAADSDTSPGGAKVSSPTFNADQTATITLTASMVGSGVRVRAQASDCASYMAYVQSTTEIRVYQITNLGNVGGVNVGGFFSGISTLNAGDTVTIEVTGSGPVDIVVKVNGSSIGTAQDTTGVLTTGQPGIYLINTATIDAFTADNL